MASDELDPSSFSCLYFGFASNLSPRTLQSRCPGSLYVGVSRLQGWKFIITELGFGNIVRAGDDDVVYGSLYFLTRQHEKALDQAELIKVGEDDHRTWHVKQNVKVQRISESGNVEGDEVEAMTYIDVDRTVPGIASKENLTFLRRAVDDGVQCGVPKAYFDKYWKHYLPEDESVGRQDTITMVRTTQMDKENTKYVPQDVLRLAGKQ